MRYRDGVRSPLRSPKSPFDRLCNRPFNRPFDRVQSPLRSVVLRSPHTPLPIEARLWGLDGPPRSRFTFVIISKKVSAAAGRAEVDPLIADRGRRPDHS